jgi:hypothetical protein
MMVQKDTHLVETVQILNFDLFPDAICTVILSNDACPGQPCDHRANN